MQHVSAYDRLFVVSDLHLAPRDALSIFSSKAQLAAWVRSLAALEGRVGLVLNGDIVDFLADQGALPFDPVGAGDKLREVIENNAEVFGALGDFLDGEGRTLVLLLGNHDVELALPEANAILLDALSRGRAERRGRIRVSWGGTGYLCAVGGRRVYCAHGNDADLWNRVNYERVRRTATAQKRGRPVGRWVPNAGSRLVVDLLNEVKVEFPFVDLLKPEGKSLVSILLALKPSLLGKVTKLWPIFAKLVGGALKPNEKLGAGGAEARRAGGARQVLLAQAAGLDVVPGPWVPGGLEADPTAKVNALLEGAERHWNMGLLPQDLAAGGHLGVFGVGWRTVVRRDVASELRDTLLTWAKGDRTFLLEPPPADDPTFLVYDEEVGSSIDVVVTGHTHLERARRRQRGGGVYFNSGTWADLLKLSPELLADGAAFARLLAALREGSRGALAPFVLHRRTVVAVTAGDGGVVTGELWHVQDGGEIEPVAGSRFVFEPGAERAEKR
ncbi:MAG: metallophosphoesterase [Polyangiaceae bacterium]|jgi:UDP-2,3-diacylglucosamine pyrophosphatase LpxH|nr:metallophosphoesterase [Polyangiaceae bacterium]